MTDRKNSVGGAVVFERIPGSAIFNEASIIKIAGLLHTQRRENVFLQKLGVRFARSALDDDSEQIIAGIAVREFFARDEFQGLITKSPDHFFMRDG